MKLKIIVLLFLLSWGCKEEFNEEADIARLDWMQHKIIALIGEPECMNAADCQAIGFGVKPCGGAWKYLIYSKSNVDSVALSDLVADYNDFNQILNERYGWVSDCSIPPKLELECRNGVCATADISQILFD